MAKHYGVDHGDPVPGPARRRSAAILLHGSGDEVDPVRALCAGRQVRHSTRSRSRGCIPNLERRYEETESEYTRQRLRSYMSRQPCRDCRGARLRPESLACTVGGRSIVDVTPHVDPRGRRRFSTGWR